MEQLVCVHVDGLRRFRLATSRQLAEHSASTVGGGGRNLSAGSTGRKKPLSGRWDRALSSSSSLVKAGKK